MLYEILKIKRKSLYLFVLCAMMKSQIGNVTENASGSGRFPSFRKEVKEYEKDEKVFGSSIVNGYGGRYDDSSSLRGERFRLCLLPEF